MSMKKVSLVRVVTVVFAQRLELEVGRMLLCFQIAFFLSIVLNMQQQLQRSCLQAPLTVHNHKSVASSRALGDWHVIIIRLFK